MANNKMKLLDAPAYRGDYGLPQCSEPHTVAPETKSVAAKCAQETKACSTLSILASRGYLASLFSCSSF